MNDDDVRTTVLECLEEIAPGAPVATLTPEEDLRTALDLDSMDVFDLLAALAERTGVQIGDAEVPALTSVEALVTRIQAG